MTKPIFIANKSTLVSNADAEYMTAVVAFQLRHHIAPAWMRTPVTVQYTSNGDSAPAGSYLITILDDSDQADALGYHTESQGDVIWGRVFARPVLDNGGDALHKDLSVASVLSHEVAEAFIDPNCNRYAEDASGNLWAVEVADPVENCSYVVTDGSKSATLSDFVLPAYFDTMSKPDDLFDYLHQLTKPFSVATNGYAVIMKGGKVTQKFGREYPAWRKASKKSDLARTQKRKDANK